MPSKKRPNQAPSKRSQLDRIESKVDGLDSRLDSVEKVQVKQEANLGEHMRRTVLLEEAQAATQAEIKPLTLQRARMEGALKVIGLIATGVSLVAGCIKIVTWIAALIQAIH
jgi:hypothetical protein